MLLCKCRGRNKLGQDRAGQDKTRQDETREGRGDTRANGQCSKTVKPTATICNSPCSICVWVVMQRWMDCAAWEHAGNI